jgi:glycosyltransferase involved in cell wall biosynthesis
MTRTASHRLSVSLITLGDPNTLTGGYLYHRRLAELAPRHGAQLVFASFPGWPFPFPVLSGPRLLRVLSVQRPDVVVLDSIATAFLAPWMAAVRGPVLAMVHQPPGGIDHGPVQRLAQAVLDRAAYRHVERVLVASQLLADQFSAQGFADKLVVIPPGRDVAPAAGGRQRDLHAGARAALLCVGNWVARKGILQALDAFARLPAGLARLHLVGDEQADPRYAARVRRRLARSDLAGRVECHGRLRREEVAALYRDADVFVLPSVREPYGTVYGEAMAAGLPVVGWRAGNLPFLADHGREGLLVGPGDVAGLALALRTLAEDGELRARLAAAARRRAATFLTWEQTAERFFAEVRAAADRRLTRPLSADRSTVWRPAVSHPTAAVLGVVSTCGDQDGWVISAAGLSDPRATQVSYRRVESKAQSIEQVYYRKAVRLGGWHERHEPGQAARFRCPLAPCRKSLLPGGPARRR